MAGADLPPKYNAAIVEAIILEVAAELHPQNLTTGELSLKIVGDADDAREVETARRAISGLSEFGLLSIGDGDVVEPTPAALRACALLA